MLWAGRSSWEGDEVLLKVLPGRALTRLATDCSCSSSHFFCSALTSALYSASSGSSSSHRWRAFCTAVSTFRRAIARDGEVKEGIQFQKDPICRKPLWFPVHVTLFCTGVNWFQVPPTLIPSSEFNPSVLNVPYWPMQIPNQEAENYACLMATTINRKSFPGGSVSKESTCNAGYPGSIPE